LALKLNITDTAAINAEIVQLRNAQALKLNISDTAAMLSSYSNKINKNIDSITAHNTRILNEAVARDNADIKTLAVTGTTTKTITLTKGDASTITGTFTDNDGGGGGSVNFNDSLAYGFKIADSSVVRDTGFYPSQLNWKAISNQLYFKLIDDNFINYQSTYQAQNTYNDSVLKGTASIVNGNLSLTGNTIIQTTTGPLTSFTTVEMTIKNYTSNGSFNSVGTGKR
jgi:hypothetical protein